MCSLTGDMITLLHIHLTTTHLNPNRCGLFVGFWLGIFAIHKTWTSLAMVEDRMIRQEPLRTQFGVLFGWFKRNFSLKTPTVVKSFTRKVEKFTFQEISARKIRKIRKVEKSKSSKNSKSRKVQIPGDFCSKNSKNAKSRKVEKFEKFEKSNSRKVRKIRKVEKFRFQEISARKIRKMRKVEKSKSSHFPGDFCLKSRKIRKVEKSKTFWLFDFLRKVLQFSRCAITGEKSA